METVSINPDCIYCEDKSCATKALLPAELEILSSGCREVNLSKGEPILSAGSGASHIIYLKSGIVKEFQELDNDAETIFQVLKGPIYLGLSSLSGDHINHLSYTSLSEGSMCFIEKEVFKSLLLKNAEFSYLILQSVVQDSLKHYHHFASQNQKHIHGKLAETLVYMAEVIFEVNEFVLPLNRSEISFLIGTSRESVSKQLRSYEREGIISISGKNIRIIELEKLRQISRFG